MVRWHPSEKNILVFSSDCAFPEEVERARRCGAVVSIDCSRAVGQREVKILEANFDIPEIYLVVSGRVDSDATAALAELYAAHSLLFVKGWDLDDPSTREWFHRYTDAIGAYRDGKAPDTLEACRLLEEAGPPMHYVPVWDVP